MTAEKRGQYGTGSVYQRASDGRWMDVIQVGWNANGRRRTVSVPGKTEAEAKRRLRDKQKGIDKTARPSKASDTGPPSRPGARSG